jgi:integrase
LVDDGGTEESTKNKAEVFLREWLVRRDNGELLTSQAETAIHPPAEKLSPTFEDAKCAFYADMLAKRRRSIGDAKRRVEKHLARKFAGREVQSITTQEIRDYQAMRLGEGAQTGGVRCEMAALKRMFRILLQDGAIASMPYIPMPAEGLPRRGFFELEEFECLLPRLPAWFRPAVTFSYLTGWRRGEVWSLTWKQVDLVEGTVRLDAGTTKSGQGRLIYFTDDLRALIEAQWQEHLEEYRDCQLVFHREGEPIRPTPALEAWRKACKAAGLEGKLMHDFRRTAARNLLRAGIDQSTAMAMLGHETDHVFRRYAIKDPRVLREAAEKLNTLTRRVSRGPSGHTLGTPDLGTAEGLTLTH